ncbi:MBL fold metallo-hydrolase [Desulfosarcina sp.]|uniref:MBL fold metallo-hydrolase n=1 Tax=Desulfosarcina sp. TaxID=2027861 RepID=UPI0029BD39A1|nr:MBL fold metallo-hydrolase [Desulfosarcina sp.]MDX2452774.1 MBL fold metallo-hydrolase [Desulfosarcina sp.]MDX2490525.1 MBL fold metallo-hydrolase [Desulfosarcina sp.]
MSTKLTILCENSVGHPFGVVGEHGFACFIETDTGNVLFDTGQGMGICGNAAVLDKNLASIQAIAISHGHYDHTGGLPQVLKQTGPVPVYGHPDIFVSRTWSDGNATRYIGMRHRREYLESLGAQFHLIRNPVEISDRVHLTGEIAKNNDFEKPDPNMTLHPEGAMAICPDPIADDLSLVIDSEKGLILVLGCAHAGMINIFDHILEMFHRDRIYAVVGGTHLGFSQPAQFDETLKAIDRYGIERIGVSHCTGLEKAADLRARLGERFFFGCVGAQLEG